MTAVCAAAVILVVVGVFALLAPPAPTVEVAQPSDEQGVS